MVSHRVSSPTSSQGSIGMEPQACNTDKPGDAPTRTTTGVNNLLHVETVQRENENTADGAQKKQTPVNAAARRGVVTFTQNVLDHTATGPLKNKRVRGEATDPGVRSPSHLLES